MKKHIPAFIALSVLGLFVMDTALASGGFRQRTPITRESRRTVTPAPAPIVQTKQLSELDLEIKREVEALGVDFPDNWTDWPTSKQDEFLADLDFLEAPEPTPVFQPQAVFNPAPRVQRRNIVQTQPQPVANNNSAESLVLDTLRSLGFGIPSTFPKWTDRKKRSFLKSLLRNDNRQARIKTTPVKQPVVAEETLSAQAQAEYEAQKAASQAAQAERIAAVSAPEYVAVATGNLKAESGKSASGSVAVVEKGDTVMITLSGDFSVSQGPDLFVTLTTEEVTNKRSLNPTKLITLDALASNNGQQVYTVSKADFEKYGDNLAIWCQAYNVLFAATELQ